MYYRVSISEKIISKIVSYNHLCTGFSYVSVRYRYGSYHPARSALSATVTARHEYRLHYLRGARRLGLYRFMPLSMPTSNVPSTAFAIAAMPSFTFSCWSSGNGANT